MRESEREWLDVGSERTAMAGCFIDLLVAGLRSGEDSPLAASSVVV